MVFGITDPQKEEMVITVKVEPSVTDKAGALERRLKPYREQGWQVALKLGGGQRGIWQVTMFRWNHPQTCQCGKCPKPQPEKKNGRR